MKRISRNNIFIGNALFIWLIFSVSYIYLKKSPKTSLFSAYFSLISEAGLDLIASIFIFSFWRILENPAKRIFLIFSISFICAFIADSLYNSALNLFDYQFDNPLINSFFEVPFAFFLFMQLCGWGSILFLNRDEKNKILYIPYAILSFLMLVIFIFGIPWKIKYFSSMGIFQMIDTVLEVISFALATICLARAKTQLVRMMGIGFLLVVSSDFIIRYYVVSGIIPYLSSLETTWILGLLFICIGLFISKKKNAAELIQLQPISSLQSQIAVWSLILWLSLLSILVILAYTIFHGNENEFNQINKDILSIIIPMSLLVIIASSYLSTKISTPLSKLENAISTFISSDNKSINNLDENKLHNSSSDGKFEIYEVEKLKKFILNSIYDIRKANLVKSEFLMNMSHDFRTPASGIFHMSRSVYKRINDPDLKIMQKLIIDSSEQLMNCLEDVLDYSRLESTQHEINIEEADVVSIINEVILFLLPKAKEKKLDIDIKSSDIKMSYKTNRIFVYRILLNIISNAIKFTHLGGITISCNQETIDNHKWVIIKIMDTGIGIDESNHKLIFEPFTRIETHETSKYPGIGLGLSNVILMLNKLGGKIQVESNLNKGSTFSVFLPVL